jgi:hypothetical protein
MADEDGTGLLAFLAAAVQVRATGYRDKADALRKMAETEPVGRLRSSLLDLSRQFDDMADSIDNKRR